MRFAMVLLALPLALIAGCMPSSDESPEPPPAPPPVTPVKPNVGPVKPAAPAKLDPALAFNAYHAGRITARLLKDWAMDVKPTPRDIELLKSAYASMKIDPGFLDLPANATYQEMARVMVNVAGEKIGAIEAHGKALRAGFAVGMQVYIVENLLRLNIGALSDENREDIVHYLRGPLLENAAEAAYSPKILAAIRDADVTLAGEPEVPRVTREKWAALVAKLDDYQIAKTLMVAE